MAERRPKNSDLALQKLEEEAAKQEPEPGILEIFERDEDAPISREDPGESGIRDAR